MTYTREQIEQILKSIIDPHTELDLISGKSVKSINIDGAQIKIQINLGYPALSWHPQLVESITSKIDGAEVVVKVEIEA